MKKNVLYTGAVLLCALGIILCFVIGQTKTIAPQLLLSADQRQELFRFPKSILEASKEDLLQVEGIGEKRADAILSYASSQKLHSMEQLQNIDGIGEELLHQLEKYFYLP